MQLNDPLKLDLDACLSITCPLCGSPRDAACCDGSLIRPIPHFERREAYDKQTDSVVHDVAIEKLF